MPRTSQTREKRRELIPIVARAFAELGYRRTTTAELARRCGVQQNILYRLWPDKKAMFIAAIAYVYESSVLIWARVLAEDDGQQTAAERLLAYEAGHHGEFGQYRIVFAGLNETDDPEVRAALANMYQRFLRFLREQIGAHRAQRPDAARLNVALAVWALVGLGTVASVGRELGLLGDRQRRELIAEVGQLLLEGSAAQGGPARPCL
jgi:AcrR family transcriptional regulator